MGAPPEINTGCYQGEPTEPNVGKQSYASFAPSHPFCLNVTLRHGVFVPVPRARTRRGSPQSTCFGHAQNHISYFPLPGLMVVAPFHAVPAVSFAPFPAGARGVPGGAFVRYHSAHRAHMRQWAAPAGGLHAHPSPPVGPSPPGRRLDTPAPRPPGQTRVPGAREPVTRPGTGRVGDP